MFQKKTLQDDILMTIPTLFSFKMFSMGQIGLIHLQPKHEIQPRLKAYPLWKTCLRQIVFVPHDDHSDLPEGAVAMEGQDATQFLIEVLCGLHSPLLGENEVFGQFKQFLEENSSHEVFSNQQKWIQFVLQEVKRVRSQYIHLLGSKSYGSLLRKLTQDSPDISIFGTGQFSEEILPWLSHKKQLQLIGRNTERLKFFEGKYAQLSIVQLHSVEEKSAPVLKHLIIAASVSHESLIDYLKRSDLSQLEKIYDLRGLPSEEEEQNFLKQMKKSGLQTPVVFLKDLFRSMESQHQQNLQTIETIKADLHHKVSAFLMRLEHRPLGWDDLCA